ncbi:MAG: CcoQ/FixQ family Cbb3-type cytochrome c oxidase assembly chaperone [SAR324 cluster bacterium]|nr:CcoQ/FixQ family Cbb3-type cytochrome c oxidase assembly chaperone [SAR324 cluster bacterium]
MSPEVGVYIYVISTILFSVIILAYLYYVLSMKGEKAKKIESHGNIIFTEEPLDPYKSKNKS